MPDPALRALRLIVLQIRDQREVERQERDCFVELSGLAADQFDWWNLVDRPAIGPGDVEGYDAVVIGGAGAHSVTETYPFTALLARLVGVLARERRPLFGSCWGHQFVAQALDGARTLVRMIDAMLDGLGIAPAGADPVVGMAAAVPSAAGADVRTWEVDAEVRGADEVGVVATLTSVFSTRGVPVDAVSTGPGSANHVQLRFRAGARLALSLVRTLERLSMVRRVEVHSTR